MKKFYLRAIDLEKLGIDMLFINTDDEVIRTQAINNARLISAAPELLEALQDFVAYSEQGLIDADTLYIAKCAIAKALGEEV